MNKKDLPDVQKSKPKISFMIEKVGIEGVRMPLNIVTKNITQSSGLITTIASIDAYSVLEKSVRGTNMSRFVEVFSSIHVLSQKTMKELLIQLRNVLKFDDVYAKISFLYPISREAPVSHKKAFDVFDISFVGLLKRNHFKFVMGAIIPVSSLCPCSKEISDRGAHNQRAFIKVQIIPSDFIWIEDLVLSLTKCGSGEVYPLLKRVDEKEVTEHMWDHPKFVEDICRDVSLKLQSFPINWFRVKVTSLESIHSHNAVSYLGMKKVKGAWKNDGRGFY